MNIVLSFCSICPLIDYFLKKNYSLRQNILKNMRVWERSLTSVQLVFIWILFMLGLDWEQAARRKFEVLLVKVHRTLHRTLLSSVRSVHRRWTTAKGVTGHCVCASGQEGIQRPVDRRKDKLYWLWGIYPRVPQDGTWAAPFEVARPVRSRRAHQDYKLY